MQIPYRATLKFDGYTEVQTGVFEMPDNPPPLWPKPNPGESFRITYSKAQDPTRWDVDEETGVIEFKDEENAKKAEALFNRLVAEIERLEAALNTPALPRS